MEVNLNNIRKNLQEIRRITKSKIMPVIKNDAYSLGSVKIAQTLEKEGIDFFAVCTIKEALLLRENNIKANILLFSKVFDDEYYLLKNNSITLTAYSLEELEELNNYLIKENFSINAHLKIDTGMTRLGFLYSENEKEIDDILRAFKFSNIKITGIYSHLSSAEEEDSKYSNMQIKLFNEVLSLLKQKNINYGFTHLFASHAALNYPGEYDYIRPGMILYGITVREDLKNLSDIKLYPAVKFFSRVISVKTVKENTPVSYSRLYITDKKTEVAVVSVGFADGYQRNLSNDFYVYINNQKCNILGRICMDHMMVDVTNKNVKVGDIVELFGDNIKIDEISKKLNTINGDILCGIKKRVEIKYVEN